MTAETRARAIAQIQQLTPELIENLAELARGVTYDDPDRGKIYKTKPDKAAIELLLAYGIGKPADKLELTGKDGAPLENMSEDERAQKLASLMALAKQRASAAGQEEPSDETSVLQMRLAGD